MSSVNQKKIIAHFTKSLTNLNKFFLFVRVGTDIFEKHNRKEYKILFDLNFHHINHLDSKFEKIFTTILTKSKKKR